MTNEDDDSMTRGKQLLGSQVLSDFGDQVTAALLALCILDITNSTEKVGFIYFIQTVGFILFTLLGGYLGDRFSKRNILCCADWARCIIVFVMMAALSEKSMTMIYGTTFFLSLLGSIHRPVKLSLWASSIPTNRLELYNCFSELSTHASVIVGPLIAAFLVAHELINWGFAIDALSFFICGLIFFFIIKEKPTPRIHHAAEISMWYGFKLITRDSNLHRYVAYEAIQMIAHGAFNATFIVLAQRDFGWSKSQYSYYLAITAGCAIFGAFLGSTRYVAKFSAGSRLAVCTILSAISLGSVLLVQSFLVSSVLFGICHCVAIIAMIVTKTNVQMHSINTYPESLAAILAARTIIIKVATLVGTGTCLLASRFFSLETTLWFFVLPLAIGFFPLIKFKTSIAINFLKPISTRNALERSHK